METILLVGGMAFIAGLIVRSLFIAPQQPQVIYVQAAESPELARGSGCLPIILGGTVVLVLLLALGGV